MFCLCWTGVCKPGFDFTTLQDSNIIYLRAKGTKSLSYYLEYQIDHKVAKLCKD